MLNNEELKSANENAHKQIVDQAKNYGQMMKSAYRMPYVNYPYGAPVENQGVMPMPGFQAPVYTQPFMPMQTTPAYSGPQNNNVSNHKNEAQPGLFNNAK